MCGIVGIIAPGKSAKTLSEEMKRLLSAIHHRGPDSGGFFVEDGIAIGMRRLSIIDLEGGSQPMKTEDQNIVLVYNGETYNFQELRNQLCAKGHVFRTQSDTEVLLHGYREWGDNLVNHLEGMFAFAIYDRKLGTLFLARDHFGIKPLYYYSFDHYFAFASEPQAFFSLSKPPRTLNQSALSDYLALKYIPAPKTFLKNVAKLPARHFLKVNLNAQLGPIRKYWDLIPQSISLNEPQAAEALGEALHRSVNMQMVSDVPVGLALSGGIDSGLLAWAMSRDGKSQTKLALTVGFDEASFDETSMAKITAKAFELRHLVERLQTPSLEELDTFIEKYGEPFANLSIPANFLLYRAAAQQVKVLLNGSGGDELFGGYDRYYAVQPPSILAAVGLLHPLLRPLFGCFPVGKSKRGVVTRARRYLELSRLQPNERHIMSVMLFLPEEIRALAPELAGFDKALFDDFNRIPNSDLLQKATGFDMQTMLPDDYLTLVDRTSMAASLEVRVPFLDLSLSQLAYSLPSSLKIRNWEKKYILRRLASTQLPESVVNQPKHGFESPVSHWFMQPLGEELLELSRRSTFGNLFNSLYIEDLLKRHRRGQEDAAKRLLALYTLFRWAEMNRITVQG